MTRFQAFLGGVALVAVTVSAPHAENLLDASPGTKMRGVATLGSK